MRLPRLATLLLALSFAPLASAGSEEDPDVRDERDRPASAGDLLAAWVEPDPRGMRIVFKSAGFDEDVVDLVYYMTIEIEGRRFSPVVGFDANSRVRTDSGANPQGWGGTRPSIDNKLIDARVERGSPGYLSAVVPWELYRGFEPGAKVTPVQAVVSMCCDLDGSGWIAPYDTAEARDRTLIVTGTSVRSASFFPIFVPAWVLPTIVIGCTAAGLAAGFALARRASRAPPKAAPAASPPPMRVAPPPPGSRFARQPPAKR